MLNPFSDDVPPLFFRKDGVDAVTLAVAFGGLTLRFLRASGYPKCVVSLCFYQGNLLKSQLHTFFSLCTVGFSFELQFALRSSLFGCRLIGN